MSSEICLHNANLLTGYSVMNNCAVLLKSYKLLMFSMKTVLPAKI